MQNKQRINWIIDAVLFGGFVLALWLDLTGRAAHQWLGLAVGALACYHLAVHGRWVAAVTGRLFGRTSRQARLFYAVDAGLAVGFAAILVTGLVISTWLDLALASYATWRTVHTLASVLTLALVVAKIGLHWRWVAGVARRGIFPAPGRPASPGAAQPMSGSIRVDRRDFLKLMGGVGAVSLLAGMQALGGGSDRTQASSAVQASSGESALAGASSESTSGSCVVRCRRGCSYPGHCRRYVDDNGNGRCDFGECLS
jgi:hypothetical protein